MKGSPVQVRASALDLNFLPISRVACIGFLCGFLLGGCGAEEDAPSLSEVKQFDAHRIYYAGEEVAGLPLEDVEGEERQRAERLRGWNFYYGDCDPPSGLFAEGGCEPPLQIHNYPTCRRWASLLSDRSEIVDFRGAKAAGSGDGIESPVEIFTGSTTVLIFAGDRNVAEAAARQLRDVRQARPSRLPPPVVGSLSGDLPCQRKPG
jgi:hypothetical protein